MSKRGQSYQRYPYSVIEDVLTRRERNPKASYRRLAIECGIASRETVRYWVKKYGSREGVRRARKRRDCG